MYSASPAAHPAPGRWARPGQPYSGQGSVFLPYLCNRTPYAGDHTVLHDNARPFGKLTRLFNRLPTAYTSALMEITGPMMTRSFPPQGRGRQLRTGALPEGCGFLSLSVLWTRGLGGHTSPDCGEEKKDSPREGMRRARAGITIRDENKHQNRTTRLSSAVRGRGFAVPCSHDSPRLLCV